MKTDRKYLAGFGNEFATEALSGALPKLGNTPQKVSFGLYAEQLSGSAFTAPRTDNQKVWLYKIRPSAVHMPFEKFSHPRLCSTPFQGGVLSPNRMRWNPPEKPSGKQDFIESLFTVAGNGSTFSHTGCSIHLYNANRSMEGKAFFSSDGDFLIVPQDGDLLFRTEMGVLEVSPGEITLIPRGIKFQVNLKGSRAVGYICENFGKPFRIPDLGPIGANGLAAPGDFLAPVADYIDGDEATELITKFGGELWRTEIKHSPFDVVAWRGNYTVFKYDLSKFLVVNTVSYDHLDPSIFTVLTSQSNHPGTANVDFVIFPPRWIVAENTFRPPYYHRNIMSEFMGLIHGVYDAKTDGFAPGGASLHNCMSGHGPEADVFEKASSEELKPRYLSNTLAFMFESRLPFSVTDFALNGGLLQQNYDQCWEKIKRNFSRKT